MPCQVFILALLLPDAPILLDARKPGALVMPAGPKARIRPALGESGVARKEAVYTVIEAKGDELRLHSRGQAGWGKRDEWVVLEDAPAHYSRLIAAAPKDPWAWNYRGIAWRARGEADKALRDFEEVVKLDPRSASARLNVGNAWAQKRDLGRAIDAFTEAIRLDEGYGKAYLSRGNAWMSKGDTDRAIKDYGEAIRLEPKHPSAYNQRGNAWIERGDYDAAIKDFTEAFRHDPGHPGSVYNRSRLWVAKGEYTKGLADLDAALKINPKFEYALAAKARLLASCPDDRIRDGKQAVKLAELACSVTRWKKGDSLDALAAAWAEAGDFEKAVQYQRRALKDEEFARRDGDEARARVAHYEARKPYRMDAGR